MAFSIQTITALTEAVTGGSAYDNRPAIGHYRSGPTLERFLGALGIELNIGKASRVPSVLDALTHANRRENGRETIIEVIETVVDCRDFIDQEEKLIAVVEYLNKRLVHDGCELRLMGNRYRVVSLGTNVVAANALKDRIKSLNFESVERDFAQAIEEADRNPAGAVTSACSTVESVCKTILDELGAEYPSKQDIQGLSNEVAKQLGLSPARTDLPALLAQDLKQILGGLQTIAGGVGALRTHFGDAHGRGKSAVAIDARIARLAIHSASTLSLFYIETWQRRNATKTAKAT